MTASVRSIIGIVGAAISGPTLALHILTHPILRSLYTPILWDQTPDPFSHSQPSTSSQSAKPLQTAGAAIALSGNGLAPLYTLGLRAAIDARSQEFTGASFWRSGYGPAPREDVKVEDVTPAEGVRLSRMANPTWSTELGTNMRIIERRDLQEVLVKRVLELGGRVEWGRKVERVAEVEDEGARRVRVSFTGGEGEEVDLLVGAEGAWSEVRRFILKTRNADKAEERWVPDYMGATGVYGISSPEIMPFQVNGVGEETVADTHGIWLDQGNLSTSPLPGGKIRWDLIIPASSPPEHSQSKGKGDLGFKSEEGDTTHWKSRIVPGVYSQSSTEDMLRKHAGVYHPVTGSFGRLVAASERIIRSPLRQRVWESDEIQCENVVLIGDASRLMLPSSGQGSAFAIEDATVLANSLLNHSSCKDNDFRKALVEYAHIRFTRSKKMATVAYYAGKFGLGEQWYWRWMRDYGTKWMSNSKDPKASNKTINQWPFKDRFTVELKKEL